MNPMISRRALLGSAVAAGVGVVLLPALESFAAAPATAPEMAAGLVFDEATRRGVADVLVSNGRDLIRTDAAGRYRLPIRDGDVLFVVKPSGWSPLNDDRNLPRFYYVHRPNGSPVYRGDGIPGIDRLDPGYIYKGSAPTGPLPKSIDFALRKAQEPDEFTAVVFGDTQVGSDRQLDYMAQGTVAELLNAPGVAFGISVGDLVNVGQLHMFGPLNELQAKTGFSWYTLPGNHDQNLVTLGDEGAEEQYRALYGPTVYAFEYGPCSFVMLGNVRRSPFEKLEDPNAEPGKGSPAASPYHNGLRDEQWGFLEAYLKTVPRDRQLVVSMHMDMKHDRARPGEDDPDSPDTPEYLAATQSFSRRLLGLLSGRPHTLSISGHTHIQRHLFFGADAGFAGPGQHHHFNTICVRGAGYRGMFNELRIPSCQAEDGVPAGYSHVTFTRTGYRIRYKASRHPADHQMNVYLPAIIHPRNLAKTTVVANVFAGSERSTVRLRFNSGAWLPMQFKPQVDPSIAWVLEQEKKPESWLGSKYNPKDKPSVAYHMWEAPLPTGLAAGTHTLEVESVDMFGQRDVKVTFFRIA